MKVVLYDIVNRLIEGEQQGYIARNNLGEHAHCNTYLCLAAFVGD